MADYAILVGISRYRDPMSLHRLNGPLNDVRRMKEWLTSKNGGGLATENVIELKTPAELAALPEIPWPDDLPWGPNCGGFSAAFSKALRDSNGNLAQRVARLYLYFSGHGFTMERKDETSAALYAADARDDEPFNLAGTLYAQAAKRARAYDEIVLIMDCCRSLVETADYTPPVAITRDASGANGVRMYSLYAAQKGGLAQEGVVDIESCEIGGFMTYDWIRALKEAPCDVLGKVHGATLKTYLEFNWKRWRGNTSIPTPVTIIPENMSLSFSSGKTLVNQVFHLNNCNPGMSLSLSARKTLNASAMLDNENLSWQEDSYAWSGVLVALEDNGGGGKKFTLRLSPDVLHTVAVSDEAAQSFMPGAQDVITL